MDEIMKNEVAVEEEREEVVDTKDMHDDALKDVINEQFKKIQRQSMLLGAQTMCTVVLEKIAVAMGKPGKRTLNDYRRLIKDIESFCKTGLSRKVDADGETERVTETEVNAEETVQN